MSEKTIALLGQPNSGKSTLFNGLTGFPSARRELARKNSGAQGWFFRSQRYHL